MTVEELRKEKSTLDFKILTLLRDFHEKTTMVVEEIGIEIAYFETPEYQRDKVEITAVTTKLTFA